MIEGVAQASAGANQMRKAKKLKPELEDPEQRSMLNYFERKRNSLHSGAAIAGAENELATTNASVSSGIVQAAGGDSGAALSGLSRLGKISGGTFNDILAKAEDRGQKYDELSAGLLDKISNRKLQLQMYEYTSALGRAGSLIDGGLKNINAGAASVAGGVGGGGGGGTSTQSSTDTGTVNGGSSSAAGSGAGSWGMGAEGAGATGGAMESAGGMAMFA